MKNYVLNKYDLDAAKILDDFLPGKLFDTHMHISHLQPDFGGHTSFDTYYDMIRLFTKDRTVRCNGIVFPKLELRNPEEMKRSVQFLRDELDKYPQNVGEVMVLPTDSAEDIQSRLVHHRIRGLKCYHIYADRPDTMYADIKEYLPESAWQVANEKRLVITLHIVKDDALAHPNNLNYILTMSKKYPDVVLILAHAARAFAPWTVFDVVDQLAGCENVWFDFSSVCETPAMLYILKKLGTTRCMWGTDYPVAMFAGKPIAIADSFYWIDGEDLERFVRKSNSRLTSWHVITEGFMAMRQTCILADLGRQEIEDLFYNNAASLFRI